MIHPRPNRAPAAYRSGGAILLGMDTTPRLTRPNITALLNRLHELTPHADNTPEYVAGYHDAMASAESVIMTMWHSAVFAARAAHEPPPTDNEVDALAAVARHLLDAARLLDGMDDD